MRKEIYNSVKTYIEGSKYKVFLLLLVQFLLIPVLSAEPFLLKVFVDNVLINKSIKFIYVISLSFIGLFLLQSFLTICKENISNQISNKIKYRCRGQIWQSYMHMPISTIENKDIGDLKLRIDEDVELLGDVIQKHYIDYIFGIAMVVINWVILLFLSWEVALICLGVILLIYLINHLIGLGSKKVNEKLREISGIYSTWQSKSYGKWKDIKSLNTEEYQINKFMRFRTIIASYGYKWIFFWFLRVIFGWIKEDFVSKVAIYFICGFFILRGELTLGSLVVFSLYFQKILSYLDIINQSNVDIHSSQPAFKRIKEILDYNFSNSKITNQSMEIKSIKIKNLEFSYDNMNRNIFSDFNIELNENDSLLIKGKSGSGKSTLLSLLSKMVKVPDNTIFINDIDINTIPEQLLYNSLSIVMQDSYLFNLTIEENIKIGNTKARLEDIISSAKCAGIHDFINNLPDGYSTIIGENGSTLSGGQRQKIILARTLLNDKSGLIIDEATSGVDKESEKRIYENIFGKQKNKLIICVCHHDINKKYFNKFLNVEYEQQQLTI